VSTATCPRTVCAAVAGRYCRRSPRPPLLGEVSRARHHKHRPNTSSPSSPQGRVPTGSRHRRPRRADQRAGQRSLGASIPGLAATTLAPGESFRLHARVTDPSTKIRGLAITIEVAYYDIAERWHKTFLKVVGRRPPDKLGDMSVTPELEVASVFLYETEQFLLPVGGSPRALERKQHEEQRLRNTWRPRVASLLLAAHRRTQRHGGEKDR
jgi:hypothetical protein